MITRKLFVETMKHRGSEDLLNIIKAQNEATKKDGSLGVIPVMITCEDMNDLAMVPLPSQKICQELVEERGDWGENWVRLELHRLDRR